MPLVFVHGVANRIDREQVEEADVRRAMFAQYVTRSWSREGGGPATIRQPYWGSSGASLAWGGASVPHRDHAAESFGPDTGREPLAEIMAGLVPDGARPRERLVATARQSMADAVDLLLAAALLSSPEQADALAALSVTALSSVRTDPSPAWLAEVTDDEAFAVRLCNILDAAAERTPSREEFGGGSTRAAVMGAVSRVRSSAVATAGAPVADLVRSRLMPPLTVFLGDVLTYLRQRTETGADGFGAKIGEEIRQASAERGPRDPFVLVAHSMGGNIVYDLLSGMLRDAGVTVDLLVTVGSQVAFFEELSLFSPHPADVPGIAGQRLPMPPGVHRWVNVYDLNDVLSFRAAPVFEGVEDYSFRSGRVRAHSAYFIMASFYARLAERLGALQYGQQAPVGEGKTR